MKFDFVIGNPPYQDETLGDNATFAPPVYNLFMDASYQIADKVELIHPARFLFNAGSTPKEWNKKMLADEHYKVLYYEQDSSKIFADTDIKGGVVVTYHDATQEFGAIETFTPYEKLNYILKKVIDSTDFISVSNFVFNQNRFNLDNLYKSYPNFIKLIGSNGKDRRFRNNIFDYIPNPQNSCITRIICITKLIIRKK